MSLENKIVLIAGRESTAMISIVKMLLHEKATLIYIAKSAADLDYVKEIKKGNNSAKLITMLADYPDYYKAVEIVDQITETFGYVDACIFYFESPAIELHLLETDITDWEKMIEMNISAYYVAIRSVFETMKVNRQGLFVTIHERSTPNGYELSKLEQLSESIHIKMAAFFFEELKSYGISFYHLVAEKTIDNQNAGAFIRELFESKAAREDDLFMPVNGRL